jgi:hypothetical protein
LKKGAQGNENGTKSLEIGAALLNDFWNKDGLLLDQIWKRHTERALLYKKRGGKETQRLELGIERDLITPRTLRASKREQALHYRCSILYYSNNYNNDGQEKQRKQDQTAIGNLTVEEII